MVQFHGGGFVLGDADDSHFHNRKMSTELGIYIIAVDYRLAPEHPYPCAVEDGESVVHWVMKHGEEFGFDRDKIIICLLYTSPSPRDATLSRMPSSA